MKQSKSGTETAIKAEVFNVEIREFEPSKGV
jgi:hypothetical protein